jgi:ubiquinone/menaquinone biosynthesis C-methylase UbiE
MIGYDALAPGYNELYMDEQLEKLRVIRRHVRLPHSAVLLDVGCGTGISSTGFNCRKIGIDESFGMLKAAGSADLQKVHGHAERLPFADNSVDCVISLTAIHNFSHQKKAIEEMKRVSRGKIVVSVLKRAANYTRIIGLCEKLLKGAKLIDTEKDTIFVYSSKHSVKKQ